MEIIHQERMAALEKGMPLPEFPLDLMEEKSSNPEPPVLPYRITFNHAVNAKERTRFRTPRVEETVLDQIAMSGPGPDRQVEVAQRDQALEECLQTLPELYQSALRQYYWLGAGVGEVAESLGVPENTVKSYLHRARKLLHDMLKERGFSSD